MREDHYKAWLIHKLYAQTKISGYMTENRRVEKHYGDLDVLFDVGKLDALIWLFEYTTEDQRQGRPNPTTLEINGILRTNLASYKSAIRNYGKFRSAK